MEEKIREEDDRRYCVYMHTSPSGKRYIGVTSMMPERRWNHGNGYKNNTYFIRAINKYNWNNFKHEIIANNLTKEEAEQKEIYFINKYNTTNINYGYNIKAGGNCAVCADTTKIKISKKAKERLAVKENNPMFGATHTDHARLRISESRKIPVRQYSLDGDFMSEYDCALNASIKTGISSGNICSCCRNKYKTAGGFIWRHIDTELTQEHIEWCNRKELSSNKRINGFAVKQYNKNGTFINEYKSIKSAEKSTGISNQNIVKCCKRKIKTAGGYIWRYYDDVVSEEDLNWCNNHAHLSARIPIVQHYKNGEFVAEYDCASIASIETGIDPSAIAKCCKGKVKTAGGYIWRYADE